MVSVARCDATLVGGQLLPCAKLGVRRRAGFLELAILGSR